MKSALLLINLLFFCFLAPSEVNANVYINEFSSFTSSDWVELYADIDTDISGWSIKDSGSYVLTIPEQTMIGPATQQLISFDTSNRLNKDGDIIKLLNKEDVLVNEISYGSEAQICSPEEGQTAGRFPDGSGNIIRFSLATRDLPNENQPDPCPTPQPSPTVTPKPTVQIQTSPTLKPTATFTANTTPILKATTKATATPKSKPSPQVKSIQTASPTISPDAPEETGRPENASAKPGLSGFLFGGAGVFLISASLYNYLRATRNKK